MRFFKTKKGLEVEAVRWIGSNWPEVYDFLYAENDVRSHALNQNNAIAIKTSTAPLQVKVGDWIVRDAGKLQSCKPDVFGATYEPVVELTKGVGDGTEDSAVGAPAKRGP